DIAVVDDVGTFATERSDALDLDARGVQRHQEHRQTLVFGQGRIGAGDQENILAVLCAGGEDLRTVDHPFFAVLNRANLGRRDVGTAVGLGVAEAEPYPATRDIQPHRLHQHRVEV